MPSLLTPPFPALIQQIPVLQHSVEVEAAFWRPKFAAARQRRLFTAIFGRNPTIRLSRARLLRHRYSTQQQKCAEILLWGYPGNLNQVVTNALPNLTRIAAVAPAVAQQWPVYFRNLIAIGGLNISTVTKFAYFFSHRFNGYRALILDSQLIAQTTRWNEVTIPRLSYCKASKNYLRYLKVMHAAAATMKCSGDQLEFFLFALGDSF
jgi:hypothetical protein